MNDVVRSRLKWRVKTGLRSAVGGVGVATSLVRREHAVRVLMYHRIDDDPTDAFSIPPARFERQMEHLAGHCDVLDFDRYAAYVRGEITLERPGVLITFDDGYESLVRHALPILRRHELPAVLFASVAAIDAADERADGDRHLTWDEVRRLHDGGIAVASHGWHHVPTAELEPARQHDELERSRIVLARELPTTISAFAYPYGITGTFDDRSEATARSVGFTHTFRAQHGAVRPGTTYLAPRIKVDQADPEWLFAPSVRGALDGWALVDRFGVIAQRGGIRRR